MSSCKRKQVLYFVANFGWFPRSFLLVISVVYFKPKNIAKCYKHYKQKILNYFVSSKLTTIHNIFSRKYVFYLFILNIYFFKYFTLLLFTICK